MTMLNNRLLQRSVTVAFGLSIILYAFLFWHHSQGQSSKVRYVPKQESLPIDGLAENDTQGTVPGNPKNGIQQLQRLYTLYEKYKIKHDGKKPGSSVELLNDVNHYVHDYGFTNYTEVVSFLGNPDSEYADDSMIRRFPNILIFSSSDKRPDGTSVFAPKPAGTRDVFAFSDLYYHVNRRQFSNYRTTLNPVGFYQVLWDDGKVETIPYDKMRYWVVSHQGSRTNCTQGFAGQAGVPDDAMTYDEYWTKIARWENAPHGSANSKGVAANGQSYR